MRWGVTAGAVAVVGLGLVACGSTTLPQAPSTAPFEASRVPVTQTGNAPVTVDIQSVSFKLDDARTLVGSLTLTSMAAQTTTVMVRVTLYSAKGEIVGDATGGQVEVPPNTPTSVPLTGQTPIGTIASATVEASIPPPPTQTPGGGPTPQSQLAVPTPP